MKPLLACENLSFAYNKNQPILSDLTFSLNKGSCLGIVGESGSGKTTIGKLLIGELDYSEGHLEFDGISLHDWHKKAPLSYAKQVQMVFQDSTETFNPHLKVWDILAEPYRIHKLPFTKESLVKLLAEVFLPAHFLDCYPHQLSGGQKQRLSIARALSLKPKLAILDEPTSSLDIITKMQILSLLADLKNKFNTSYILITHELHIAKLLSDDLIVLKEGKIVESGPSNRVFSSPSHPYSIKLLTSINSL